MPRTRRTEPQTRPYIGVEPRHRSDAADIGAALNLTEGAQNILAAALAGAGLPDQAEIFVVLALRELEGHELLIWHERESAWWLNLPRARAVLASYRSTQAAFGVTGREGR
jgi:hypothetical protein